MFTTTHSRFAALAATLGLALVVPATGQAATQVFGSGAATWTVPAGVTSIHITAVGASGGRDGAPNSGCTPGHGQTLSDQSASVTPGETIGITVGSQGGDGSHATGGTAGQPNGGAGGTVAAGIYSAGGGGGGGSTTIRSDTGELFVIAAGGGGCGGFGSSAGGNGGDGTHAGAAGSGGAGGGTGGAGGQNVPADGNHGGTGTVQTAGAGSGSDAFLAGGGGGGGGATGGGGGGAAASGDGSGGGGSGGATYVGSGSWVTGISSSLGDGSVTITYATDPPFVTSPSATDVGDTTATVGATVDGLGSATTYHIEYGPTIGYGQQTAQASAGAGQETVSATLGALTPNMLYHYRVVATNGNGTVFGGDATFQTTPAPTAQTGTVSAVSDTGATIAGIVNPLGSATQYFVEYGPTAGYGLQTPGVYAGNGDTPQPVSVPLSGLTPGTVYHYRVVAQHAFDVVNGADATFTTTGAPSSTGTTGGSAGQPTAGGPGSGTPTGGPGAGAPAAGQGSGTPTGGPGSGTPTADPGAGTPATTPTTRNGSSLPPAAARLALLGTPVVAGSRVRYRLACATAPCHVTVQLVGPHGVGLGSQQLLIRSGRNVSQTLRLNGRGQRLARGHRTLSATLRIALTGTSARPRTVRLTFRR